MSLSADGSRSSAQIILDALIALNEAEDAAAQMKRLSPRIKSVMETERIKLPVPILTHHDRMRGRGRRSAVEVRHDVCSGCHISIAQGLRFRLRHKMDLNVCENCGSYMYLEKEVVEASPAFNPADTVVRKSSAPATPVRKVGPGAKPKKRLALAR